MEKQSNTAELNRLEKSLVDTGRIENPKYFIDYVKNNKNALDILDEREEIIIKQSFGFNGDYRTLEKIGQMFNLTGERINQIRWKAVYKIKEDYNRKRKESLI